MKIYRLIPPAVNSVVQRGGSNSSIRSPVPNHFAQVSRSTWTGRLLSSRIQCTKPLFRVLAIEFVERFLDYPLSLLVHWRAKYLLQNPTRDRVLVTFG